jgi:hypothetical protein
MCSVEWDDYVQTLKSLVNGVGNNYSKNINPGIVVIVSQEQNTWEYLARMQACALVETKILGI